MVCGSTVGSQPHRLPKHLHRRHPLATPGVNRALGEQGWYVLRIDSESPLAGVEGRVEGVEAFEGQRQTVKGVNGVRMAVQEVIESPESLVVPPLRDEVTCLTGDIC